MKVESFPELMLAVSSERNPRNVFSQVVRGLVECRQVVLARVWLIDRGDICAECRMRRECPDQSRCLHLVASAGNPLDPEDDYSRLDGAFRRFPLGVRKIGRVASTGQALILSGITPDSEWVARPEWVESEEVATIAAQPLIYSGEVLGVLAVFDRQRLDAEQFRWLRIFADHAAIVLANARAYEEIERLNRRLSLENEYLREEVAADYPAAGIVGSSPGLARVLDQVSLVAPTQATVLIEGESGTGKELIARAIHEKSSRSSQAMVRVNCGAIPENLFESEFFGHVRGSFTGAVRDRVGRFETADGGTLFLDEIGEIPLGLQAKLLRVLQEGTFERVGEERTRRVDVRVVAATNRNLRQEVAAGRFREDLFFRLSVFPISLPPLRDRRDDVPALVDHFLRIAFRKLGRKPPRVSAEQYDLLRAYDWPGNIRELQHVVERAAILAKGNRISFELAPSTRPPSPETPPPLLTRKALRQQERTSIEAALRSSNGRIFGKGGAAELLGMKPTTLASRIHALGIPKVKLPRSRPPNP
ncbi:MAG: sigma 54-interacting transcriptional regulator [Terrimicrobiaceae bacterium]|nr:sigma 54-interacting transcriptional regulator [Terrimicrobiaceae bacterium]